MIAPVLHCDGVRVYNPAQLRQISDLRLAHLRLESDLARLRFLLAFERFARLAAKAGYDPDQPRDDRGRWTNAGGGTRIAEGARPYAVILAEEEARGGHAIRTHVGKSDPELLVTLRAMRIDTPLVTVAAKAQDSIASLESANDFVNRVLETNSPTVDLVASGAMKEAWLQQRFGYPTGREAFRPDADAEPSMRSTYDVGVYIRHDARSERGYTVITAYPRNDNPSQ